MTVTIYLLHSHMLLHLLPTYNISAVTIVGLTSIQTMLCCTVYHRCAVCGCY